MHSAQEGELGAHFSGIARLVKAHDDKSLLDGYLSSLSKVRTRLNQIKNQGSVGSGAAKLMRQTLILRPLRLIRLLSKTRSKPSSKR